MPVSESPRLMSKRCGPRARVASASSLLAAAAAAVAAGVAVTGVSAALLRRFAPGARRSNENSDDRSRNLWRVTSRAPAEDVPG